MTHGKKPQVAMPGGVIQVTDQGMERLIAERNQIISQHLEEMNKEQAVEGSAINAVLLAAVQHGGLPPLADHASFFASAKALAKIVSDDQLSRRANNVKELLKHLNIHQATPALVWACKRAGVELFDPDPRDAEDAGPKLVAH